MAATGSSKPAYDLVYAPQAYRTSQKSIFLSGSIDQGYATWQTSIIDLWHHLPVTILNPHRRDWDSSWTQDISDARFQEQVNWELDAMEHADVIAVYFSPSSAAPITLLELGLFARSGKLVVACPDGYWRKGNVQVICQRFGIELLENLGDLATAVARKLGEVAHD